MKQVFILSHDFARRGAETAVAVAPDGWKVTIEEPKRNLDQNAKLHAALSEIAKSRKWSGKSWSVEVWKRLLIAAWMRTRNEIPMMLPAIDGHGVEVIFTRSSELSKKECSDLVDYVEAWQHGGAV